MRIALLAERLRVEDRLLIDAFSARGHDALLVDPSAVNIELINVGNSRAGGLNSQPSGPFSADLAVDRGPATTERAALGALLAGHDVTVINYPATSSLLGNRLSVVRHLALANIPIAPTIVSFGEAGTFDAVSALGYPVLLKSIVTDHHFPTAMIEDRDAAEAIIEHRVTLGAERGVLVQRFVSGPNHSIRIVVVGHDIAAIERRALRGWRPAADAAYDPFEGNAEPVIELGRQVVDQLGDGIYSVEVIQAESGPTVVGVENLVDFRSMAQRGEDIAGSIADFALSQRSVLAGGEPIG